MTVIDIRSFATDRLNSLPPHSRLRPGYIDMLRHLNKADLEQERIDREFVAAVAEELARDPAFALHAGLI